MSYDYRTQRHKVFTEDGSVMFTSIRDETFRLLAIAGACRWDKMVEKQVGDGWDMLACVDRMVELGEIKPVPMPTMAQYTVYVKGK